MQAAPHVERLARLLHNRIVRRVLHAHPDASVLLVVGDLVDGAAVLGPVAVWDSAGSALAGGSPELAGDGADAVAGRPSAWQTLVDDLRPDFLLLGRVSPVELFVPYLLDLRQIDLRLDVDDRPEEQPSY